MARVTDDYVRKAFLARFGRMTRESQDAVIEALTVVRDVVNPEQSDSDPIDQPLLKESVA